MITMDGKEQQTMGATHSRLYRELLSTQNKLAEQVEWVKHAFGEDRKALAAALARAEAAEAERNELRERHDNLKTAYANLVEEAAGRLVRRLVRMYAAERRVAALEAQLAAQGWRPISTDPNEPGMYIIMDRSRTYAQVWWWIEETYEYESGDEYNECPLLIPAYWNASPDGDSDCLELDGADADAAYWQRVLPPDAATEQTA